jgi:drug/metabolite transporter (DMT)-like permease
MMNLSSNTLMDTFSKKARNLFALLLAAGTLQAAIPVTLLATSSTLLTAGVAQAVESTSVTLVQGFGWDPSNSAYKVLIQTRNGNQYFVWYDNLIGAKVGSVITLTYEGSGPSLWFYKLINTGNGKESNIRRSLKAN